MGSREEEKSCTAEADCAAALMRRSSGQSLIQNQVLSSKSVLRADAARIAAHIRSKRNDPTMVGTALLASLQAVQEAMVLFTATPPKITDGIAILGTRLLDGVKGMIPADVQDTGDVAEFESVWTETFTRLPTAVQSIKEDIQSFVQEGATDKLMHALETILLETGAVVSKLLPEQVGDEVAKYLGAVVDALGGIGDGVEAFGQGNTTAAIESIYQGLQAATRGLVPAEIQNDDTYKAVTAMLDSTVGQLSKHVLEYKQQLEQSNVCWKGYANRDRQRPNICEDGYNWDGEQWCLPKSVTPYTIQSVRSGKYLNVHTRWFGNTDEANVQVWDNPDSDHSQWKIQRAADGSYIIQNVHHSTYLQLGGGRENGANVQMSANAASVRSEWKLQSTSRSAIFTIESADAVGKYINLDGGAKGNGANVQIWDNSHSEDSHWRIVSAGSGDAFKAPAVPASNAGLQLLETAVAFKRPSGALPAACGEASGFPEKRGSWCYAPCPSGYEPSGARCQTSCGAAFPSDGGLMCGKNAGAIASAIARMVGNTIIGISTIGGSDSPTGEEGSAAVLAGTMQSFIDLGKAFAHPICPV